MRRPTEPPYRTPSKRRVEREALPDSNGYRVPTPYQISKGADRFCRRWQAEDESGQHRFARRAYTPEGAVRLMTRDIAVYERTGRKSRHQRLRLWWVQTRCRIGWHRWHDGTSWRPGRFCLTCGRKP